MKRILTASAIVLMLSVLVPGKALSADKKAPSPAEVSQRCYCAECGMNVKTESALFVSEIIFSSGKVLFFCDIGDMMIYYDVMSDKGSVAVVYVKDYSTGEWVDGRQAYYMTGAKVKTPMRFGYLAFGDKARADAFRASNGGEAVYSFTEMIASRIFRR